MKPARQILGAIGTVGIIGWGVWSWFASMLRGWGDGSTASSSHVSVLELLFVIGPLVVFLFYVAITLSPCSARTALLVGSVLHIPLLAVIFVFFTKGPGALPFGLLLLLGPITWLAYVRELRREETKE